MASYSNNAKNGWDVWAKYIVICEEGNFDGVRHLCGFVIYEKLIVVLYESLVDKFTCTSMIIVIVEDMYSNHAPSCVRFFLQKCT